jgi:putative transcription factor
MASCDMCGKSDAGFRALVEGVELTVCEKCSKFGKILVAPRIVQQRSSNYSHSLKKEDAELLEFVMDDASSKIKAKREQLKLTQQEFAKMVGEKESLIHHIELDASHLSLEVAKRLERMLHITLVERAKEALVQKTSKKPEAFTLGDYIRIKK